jgi:hypothetical protein
MREAGGQTGINGIARIGHHDRGIACPLFGGRGSGVALRDDDIDVFGDEFADEPGEAIEFALRRATLENDVTVGDIAAPGKVAHHSGAQYPSVGRADGDQSDTVDLA